MRRKKSRREQVESSSFIQDSKTGGCGERTMYAKACRRAHSMEHSYRNRVSEARSTRCALGEKMNPIRGAGREETR